MRHILKYMAIAIISFAGCKKTAEEIKDPSKPGKEILHTPSTVYDPCNEYTELQNVNSELVCTFQSVPLKLTGQYYQVYCDNGQPITVVNGLRAYGSLEITNPNLGGTIVLQPNHPSNQFAIAMPSWSIDIAKYDSGVYKFNTAWNKYVDSPSKYNYPYIDQFIPASTSSTSNVTGKLIRITSGSGFALAPQCHPDVKPSCMEILPVE